MNAITPPAGSVALQLSQSPSRQTPGEDRQAMAWRAQVKSLVGRLLSRSTETLGVQSSGPSLITSWQGTASADDGEAEIVGNDGSRQVFAHRASEIAGGTNLAAIIDPPGDLQHGPRPGATVCVVGQPRALASFPDADPHSLTWSPDGSRLLVIHDFIDWIHP